MKIRYEMASKKLLYLRYLNISNKWELREAISKNVWPIISLIIFGVSAYHKKKEKNVVNLTPPVDP